MTITAGERTFPGLQNDGRSILRRITFAEFVDIDLRVDKSGDGDGRTFDGIAVPYHKEIDVDGWFFEEWIGNASAGPFDAQFNAPNRVKVGHRHIMLGGDLVGALRGMGNDNKGLRVQGRITPGVRSGDEALALMDDRALDELSIGFYRVAGGDTTTRDKDNRPHIKMTKARLFEVALEPWGAYGRGAKVDGLRSQGGAPAADNDRVTIYLGGREIASYRLAELAAPAPEPTPADDVLVAVEVPALLPELPAIDG